MQLPWRRVAIHQSPTGVLPRYLEKWCTYSTRIEVTLSSFLSSSARHCRNVFKADLRKTEWHNLGLLLMGMFVICFRQSHFCSKCNANSGVSEHSVPQNPLNGHNWGYNQFSDVLIWAQPQPIWEQPGLPWTYAGCPNTTPQRCRVSNAFSAASARVAEITTPSSKGKAWLYVVMTWPILDAARTRTHKIWGSYSSGAASN